MSDLISREDVMTIIAKKHLFKDKNDFDKCVHEIARQVKKLPSADILEHARAIKEYCESRPNEHCDNCVFGIKNEFYKCGLDDIPHMWVLPEGEKEPPIFTDTAPLKGCKNTAESYGEICVKCNKCGRFDLPEGEKGGAE